MQHRGISPRSLAHIFQEVNARIETAFIVTITYMEIYNEKMFDLLVDPAVDATKVPTQQPASALPLLACAGQRYLVAVSFTFPTILCLGKAGLCIPS